MIATYTKKVTEIAKIKDLLPIDRVVYMVLRSYAWNGKDCFPSASTVAEDVGISVRYFWIIIARLKEKRLITVSARQGRYGNTMSNLYTFNDEEPEEPQDHISSETEDEPECEPECEPELSRKAKLLRNMTLEERLESIRKFIANFRLKRVELNMP